MVKQRGSIADEILAPLLCQLTTIKRRIIHKSSSSSSSSSNGNAELNPILDRIKRNVQQMKAATEEKEKQLIDDFEDAFNGRADDLLVQLSAEESAPLEETSKLLQEIDDRIMKLGKKDALLGRSEAGSSSSVGDNEVNLLLDHIKQDFQVIISIFMEKAKQFTNNLEMDVQRCVDELHVVHHRYFSEYPAFFQMRFMGLDSALSKLTDILIDFEAAPQLLLKIEQHLGEIEQHLGEIEQHFKATETIFMEMEEELNDRIVHRRVDEFVNNYYSSVVESIALLNRKLTGISDEVGKIMVSIHRPAPSTSQKPQSAIAEGPLLHRPPTAAEMIRLLDMVKRDVLFIKFIITDYRMQLNGLNGTIEEAQKVWILVKLKGINEVVMSIKMTVEKDVLLWSSKIGTSVVDAAAAVAFPRRYLRHRLYADEINLLLDEIKQDVHTRFIDRLEEVMPWRVDNVEKKSSVIKSIALLKTKLMDIHSEIARIKLILLDKDHILHHIKDASSSSSSSTSNMRVPSSAGNFYIVPMLVLWRCFLFLNVLSEGEFINKRLLMEWFLGARIATSEVKIDEFIQELISLGLIKPLKNKWSCSKVVGCKLDPDVRTALASSDFAHDQPKDHVFLFEKTNKEVLTSTREEEEDSHRVSVLYNISNKYVRLDKDWFLTKKDLRVIQLGRWQHGSPEYHIEVESTGFLDGLHHCTSLEYLSLRGISEIDKLPDSIRYLNNLLSLDLRACHDLVKLPPAITLLKRLRFLDVSECYQLEYMPKGLGDLTEVEVIKGFVIGDSARKSIRKVYCRLTELARLKKLRKLSISIKTNSEISEEESCTLQNLVALESLTIKWALSEKSLNSEKQQIRRETVCKICRSPPPSLKKLDLRCFPIKSFSEWMDPQKFGSLKTLCIRGGCPVSLSNARSETHWQVEVLRLKYLNDLEIGWEDLHAAFPNLSCLEVQQCDKLKSFPCDREGVWTKP